MCVRGDLEMCVRGDLEQHDDSDESEREEMLEVRFGA